VAAEAQELGKAGGLINGGQRRFGGEAPWISFSIAGSVRYLAIGNVPRALGWPGVLLGSG
jgi:hypothetical protein